MEHLVFFYWQFTILQTQIKAFFPEAWLSIGVTEMMCITWFNDSFIMVLRPYLTPFVMHTSLSLSIEVVNGIMLNVTYQFWQLIVSFVSENRYDQTTMQAWIFRHIVLNFWPKSYNWTRSSWWKSLDDNDNSSNKSDNQFDFGWYDTSPSHVNNIGKPYQSLITHASIAHFFLSDSKVHTWVKGKPGAPMRVRCFMTAQDISTKY